MTLKAKITLSDLPPQKLTEATLLRIYDHLWSDGLWCFVSADRLERNYQQNREHHKHLWDFLEANFKSKGPISVRGYYREVSDVVPPGKEKDGHKVEDHTYFLWGLTKQQVDLICHEAFDKHQQVSVLWGNFKDKVGVWLTFAKGFAEEQIIKGQSIDLSAGSNPLEDPMVWTRFKGHKFKFEHLLYSPSNHVDGYGWIAALKRINETVELERLIDHLIENDTTKSWPITPEIVRNWPAHQNDAIYADMPNAGVTLIERAYQKLKEL
jgi:hypothetical protein